MANISTLLNTISIAVYGRDMRSAIHDAINLVNNDVASKEPAITKGDTSQYYRGDKTFADFSTSVRKTVLTGLSIPSTVTSITADDTVLTALGKLQAYVASRLSTNGGILKGELAVTIDSVPKFKVCCDGDEEIYVNTLLRIDGDYGIQIGSDKPEAVYLTADKFIMPPALKIRGSSSSTAFDLRGRDDEVYLKVVTGGLYLYNGALGSEFTMDKRNHTYLRTEKFNAYYITTGTKQPYNIRQRRILKRPRHIVSKKAF